MKRDRGFNININRSMVELLVQYDTTTPFGFFVLGFLLGMQQLFLYCRSKKYSSYRVQQSHSKALWWLGSQDHRQNKYLYLTIDIDITINMRYYINTIMVARTSFIE